MVVKIDDTEPNIFPGIFSTDVELKSPDLVEMILITLIEGRAVRIKSPIG